MSHTTRSLPRTAAATKDRGRTHLAVRDEELEQRGDEGHRSTERGAEQAAGTATDDRPLEQVANLVKLSRAHRLADAYCHSVFEELKDILAQPRNHWLE